MKDEKIISIEDIKCKQIVELIKFSTERILRFKNVVNSNLKYAHLKAPKILIIRKENELVSDYNGVKPGYKYRVFWCLTYLDVNDESSIFKTFEFQSPKEGLKRYWPPHIRRDNIFNFLNTMNEDDSSWPPFFVFFEAVISEESNKNTMINFGGHDIPNFRLYISDYCYEDTCYDYEKGPKFSKTTFQGSEGKIECFLEPNKICEYIDIIDKNYSRFENQINICQQLRDTKVEIDLYEYILNNEVKADLDS